MPRSRPVRSSFVAGEWSPLMQGRVDVAKYLQAATRVENFLVQPQGGITRRAGTRFVSPAKAVGYDPLLLPFEFGPSQSFVIEFGDFYARFFTLGGQLITDSITTAIVNGDFSQGLTGWAEKSVAPGARSVVDSDVLVQANVGTPIGNMTLGGGLNVPFGGVNTANFYPYHRLRIDAPPTGDETALSLVRFYEGNRVAIAGDAGDPFSNLVPPPTGLGVTPEESVLRFGSAERDFAVCVRSTTSPTFIGQHWHVSGGRKITGFQVYGSRDKGFKFATDQDVTVALHGSTSASFSTFTTLAQVVAPQGHGQLVQLFDDDTSAPTDWVNAARSAGNVATIGKHWSAPKLITGFVVRGSGDHGFKKSENPLMTITLQGSNDNFATAVDLATTTVADVTGPIAASVRRRVSISTAYSYHRLRISGGLAGNGIAVTQVQFFERASDIRKLHLDPHSTGTAIAEQAITIAADSLGARHTLNFRAFEVSAGAQLAVRVGSASGLDDFMAATVVGEGTQSLTFVPTSSPAFLQFRSVGDDIVEVDSVSLLAQGPYEIATPYSKSELRQLVTEQAGDVMWIAHPKHPLARLIRRGDTDWAIEDVDLHDGPYLDINLSAITITPSNSGGQGVTLVASAGIFRPGHVGSTWRLCSPGGVPGWKTWHEGDTIVVGENRKYERNLYRAATAGTAGNSPPIHERGTVSDGGVSWTFRNRDGWGWCVITGYTSSTQVTCDVKLSFDGIFGGGGTPTDVWREGAFSDYRGWPAVVGLVGDRLLLGSGIAWYLSSLGIFDDFTPGDDDDNAISGQLAGSIGSPIRWATGHQRILLGTSRAPWVIRSSGEDEALTPKNVQVRQQNAAGSAALQAVKAEDAVLYFSRSARRIYELTIAVDPSGGVGYKAVDLTVLGSHILGSGGVRLWLAREPHPIIWALREDGQLATLTYNAAESVVAWSRQTFGGDAVASHAIIPGANDDQQRDEVWLCMRRQLGGETVRTIEYLQATLDVEAEAADAWFVDCALRSDPTQTPSLLPGDGCDVAGAKDVPFTAGSALWSAADLFRLIRQSRTAGLAEIQTFVSPTQVLCEIIKPFAPNTLLGGTKWGMSALTFSGLDHLEGQVVRILVDGGEHPDRTVIGGTIVLQQQGFEVLAGLAVDARFESLSIPEGGVGGPSLGAKKRTSRVVAGLVSTGGGDIGFATAQDGEDVLQPLILRQVTDGGGVPPLFTGLHEVQLDCPYDDDPKLVIQTSGALPLTVTHVVMADLAVEELS